MRSISGDSRYLPAGRVGNRKILAPERAHQPSASLARGDGELSLPKSIRSAILILKTAGEYRLRQSQRRQQRYAKRLPAELDLAKTQE
jgi:hypothetical protein